MADTQQQTQQLPSDVKKGKFAEASDVKASDLKKKSPQVQKPLSKTTEKAEKEVDGVEGEIEENTEEV